MSNTQIASIKKLIDSTLWDEAISVIGKFMGNEKIYADSLQDIYQAEQQYKQLKTEMEQLNKQADKLQAAADEYQLKTAAMQKLGANQKLLTNRLQNLKKQINTIQKIRMHISELGKQSVADIYQKVVDKKAGAATTASVTIYSDYKYFTRSLHYNFSTSNRDELGTEATTAINSFYKHKLGLMPDLTHKLLNIYSTLNNAAATKEKCLSAWQNPVSRETLIKYISDAKRKTFYKKQPFKLIEYMHGQHEDIFGKKNNNDRIEELLKVYVQYLHEAYKQLNELNKIILDTHANRKIIINLNSTEKEELAGYQHVIANCLLRCRKEIEELKTHGFEKPASGPPIKVKIL